MVLSLILLQGVLNFKLKKTNAIRCNQIKHRIYLYIGLFDYQPNFYDWVTIAEI